MAAQNALHIRDVQSSFRIISLTFPCRVRRQSTLTSESLLKKAKIANSGSTQGLGLGLRARFGRLFQSATNSAGKRQQPEFPEVLASERPEEKEEQGGQERASSLADDSPKASSKAAGGQMTTTLYLSHGSPMLAIQYDDPARAFIMQLSSKIEKPKAIVVISAHWDTTEPTVNAMTKNDTIYDFYGFPNELFKLKYDAPGKPELTQRVVELLREGGFPKAKANERRGLDHGAWIPLLLMYPEKDIPVVQLSVQYRKSAAHHYKVGQALAPLKNEGVMIIGSGSATHNIRAVSFEPGPVYPWALAFDDWLNETLVNKKHDELINYTEKAPYASKCHPTPDHFLPALVAAGAAGEDSICERLHSSWAVRSISMASFAFKPPTADAAVSAY